VTDHESEQNKIKEYIDNIRKTSDIIKTTSQKIDESQEKLKDRIGLLQIELNRIKPFYRISDILNEINKVIEYEKTNDSALYILSYSPIFGQYSCSNLSVIENDLGDKIKNYRHEEIEHQIISKYEKLRRSNCDSILSFATNNKIHLAFLKNNWTNESHDNDHNRYESLIKRRVLFDSKYININKHSYTTEYPLKNIHNPSKTFIFSSSEEFHDDSKLIDKVVNTYKKQVHEFLHEIKKNVSTPNIYEIDYIPFQFIVNYSSSKNEGKAMLIFTNYNAIGVKNAIIAFTTQDKELCQGLTEMFSSLANNQKMISSNLNDFQKIFKTDKLIQMVLRSDKDLIGIQDKYSNKELKEFTPTVDNKAKDNILKILYNNHIFFYPESYYINKDEQEDIINNSSENILFSVGLYSNTLSHIIVEKFSPLVEMKYSPTKKITFQSNGSSDVIVLNDEHLENTNIDFSIFARITINSKKYFLFGGINAMGTSHANECLTTEFMSQINEQVKTEDFICAFRIEIQENIPNVSIVKIVSKTT
jgi:hypothetical protein